MLLFAKRMSIELFKKILGRIVRQKDIIEIQPEHSYISGDTAYSIGEMIASHITFASCYNNQNLAELKELKEEKSAWADIRLLYESRFQSAYSEFKESGTSLEDLNQQVFEIFENSSPDLIRKYSEALFNEEWKVAIKCALKLFEDQLELVQ